MEFISSEKHKESPVSELLSLVDGISRELNLHGITLRSPPEKTYEILPSVPPEKISALNEGLRAYLDVITGVEPAFNIKTEWRLVRKAMERWGLKPADTISNSLETYLEDDHLIEIYDQDGVQLYRNFAFFRYCSYSLLELALVDWPNLYERPSRINDVILEKIQNSFLTGKVVGPNEIPEHILRERYLDANRAFLVNVKNLIPLAVEKDPSRKAFMSVIKADLIAEGNEAAKIQYI